MLVSWAGAIALTQRLEQRPLLIAAVLLLLAAAWADPTRAWTLVKRARYLLLAIFMVFAWGTPGRLLWPQSGWLSPSAEGVALALTHGLRLLCVLSLVALLLARLAVSRLVCGLCGVLWPLRWLGLNVPRAALRLELVLRYCTADNARLTWREWLSGPPARHERPVRLALRPFRPMDWLSLVGVGVLLGVMW